jgi:NADH-quinone oxidoreductase subunit M
MLYLYRRIAFGVLDKPDVAAMPDLSLRELSILVPIALATLWMGIYPESFLKPMRGDVSSLLARIERARPAGDADIQIPPISKSIPVTAHEGAH